MFAKGQGTGTVVALNVDVDADDELDTDFPYIVLDDEGQDPVPYESERTWNDMTCRLLAEREILGRIRKPKVVVHSTGKGFGTPLVVGMPASADPKAQYGATKPSYALIPGVADAITALAAEDGAKKYGAYNFRENKVAVMTYANAALRHLKAWIDGEEFTSDTGVPNLGGARYSLDIIMDARAAGTAIDDRPLRGYASEMQDAAKAWKKAIAEGMDPKLASETYLLPAMVRVS